MKRTLATLVIILSMSCAPKNITSSPGNYLIKYGTCICEINEEKPIGKRDIKIYCTGEKINGTAVLSIISDKPIENVLGQYTPYCK